VVQGLTGEAPRSSQDAFLEFHEAASIIDIYVHSVPGRQNVGGNEEADRLAKEGSAPEPVPNLKATYAGVLSRPSP
jgi:ribonuclease HI